MAVIKRNGKHGASYQARVRGSDGHWVSKTFDRKADAEAFESKTKHDKSSGLIVKNISNQVSLSEYFDDWNEGTRDSGVSIGWRHDQIQQFRTYVEPVIGKVKLQNVKPIDVTRVMKRMNDNGLSKQMQRHIFSLLHKMFADAIELFEVLNRNPAIKKIRPTLDRRESRYLSISDVKKLIEAAKGSRIETAVLLQLFIGLRAGEVQSLRWSHVDFEQNKILIGGTYVRKEGRFKDYPKGGEQHRVTMPIELREHLLIRRETVKSVFVASDHATDFLNYNGYYKGLQSLCKRAGLPWIGTHGLRHSTSEIYLESGATVYDIHKLFAHSDMSVTERYIHDRGSRLADVANVIRLVPRGDCSQNVPKSENKANGTK